MFRFLIAFISLCYSLNATENISLQLKWKHSFQFAGFYMAKEKGFYKEAGLHVDIKELTENINVIYDVLRGTVTYGVGDSALVYYIMKGYNLKLLMPLLEKSPLALVSTNLNVKKLKDIEKESIILDKIAVNNPSILAMLKSQDIDIEKLNIKSKIYCYNDLKKMKMEVFPVYMTDEVYSLDKLGIKYNIFKPSDYGFDLYGDILFTSEEEVENHPQRVYKFKEATKKGWEYAFKHIDETIKVIFQKYNSQHFTYEKLKNEASKMRKYVSKDFNFSIEKLNRIEDIYLLLNRVKKRVDIKKYISPLIYMSKEQRNFIKQHKLRCVSTTTWEPFNMLDSRGRLVGLSRDFWHLIAKRTGIKLECTIVNNWSEILKAIEYKKADLTLSTSNIFDERKFAVFSKPYASFKIAIVTRNSVGFISDIKLLKNRKIAVGKNYTVAKILQKNYKSLNFVEVENSLEALRYVENGKVYAMIDIFPVATYMINHYKFANLKISGEIPISFDVRIMLREDYKILLPLINQAIDLISKKEKEEIYKKYISVDYQKGYSKEYIFKLIIIGIIIILTALGWIVYLKKEINKRTKLEVELERLATIDRLTSIFNRYKMDISLDEQIKVSKRYDRFFSVIFFDIDHFKTINDTYGHRVGDIVLIELSKFVANNIRESDIFGRWGGEEFLIILPETSLKEAVKLAEKLRYSIAKHSFETVNNVYCSFGVTEFLRDDNAERLIKRVDDVMYKAKQNGRNRVEFI